MSDQQWVLREETAVELTVPESPRKKSWKQKYKEFWKSMAVPWKVWLFLLAMIAFVLAMVFAFVPVKTLSNEVKMPKNSKIFDNFVSDVANVYLVATRIIGTRTLLFDPSGDLLTVARGEQKVYALWENPASANGEFDRAVILDCSGMNLNFTHGLAFNSGFIYVSSDRTVWRWPYTPGSRTRIRTADMKEVVWNMGAGGRGGAPLGHTTRTMVFGPDNYLYIGISSLNNVDSDSSRSRVYRFPFSNFNSMSQSFDFQTGQIWADGLRNPLAIMFDSRNRLWELDNGPDNLSRPDILADIYQDNPAEELNLLDGPAWYGYPHCFTVGNLTRSFGTDPQFLQQFAWAPNSVYNDAFCQNAGNNRPPVSGIPAHSSPIQGTFFQECGQLEGSFPCSMKGDLFASLHGSWNRERPVGYSVIRIPFDENGNPKGPLYHQYIAQTKDYETICNSANGANLKCFRPAGLAFKDGIMYVSSGATNEIVRLVMKKQN